MRAGLHKELGEKKRFMGEGANFICTLMSRKAGDNKRVKRGRNKNVAGENRPCRVKGRLPKNGATER